MTIAPGAVPPEVAERPYVVALDIGSSSIRAALYDRKARPLRGSSVRVDYLWNVGADGSVRLPHDTLVDLVSQTLDLLMERAGPLCAEVVGGGISCFFHSLVGLNEEGAVVTPVLSWADGTSAGEASDLRRSMDAAEVYAGTGAPLHASYWPARIVHLRQRYPDVRRWCGFPEILIASMVGRLVVSRSMASGTGLYDRARGQWFVPLLEHLGIATDDLPELVDDDEPIGHLVGPASQRWAALGSVAWFAPWGDGACNSVGLGATNPGIAALTAGTSGALRVLIDDPSPQLPAGLFSYRLGGGSVLGGQLSEGGGLLSWASRQLHGSPASLVRAAALMAPDAHGLTVLPFVFGERGLGYHDHARGTISGLRADTNPAAIYRALVESVAYSFASVYDVLSGALGHTPAITASGGALTRSPLLAQTIADTLGFDITVTRRLEGSLRGAALLALQGSGLRPDRATRSVPGGRTVRHDRGRADVYADARRRRDALYAALLDTASSHGSHS